MTIANLPIATDSFVKRPCYAGFPFLLMYVRSHQSGLLAARASSQNLKAKHPDEGLEEEEELTPILIFRLRPDQE